MAESRLDRCRRSILIPSMCAAEAKSIHDLGLLEIERLLESDGVNPHHAKSLWRALYRDDNLSESNYRILPPLRRWLDRSIGYSQDHPWTLDTPECVDEIHSHDGLTRKFLLRLADGQVIETVLMGYEGRHTVCVSSQAGCARRPLRTKSPCDRRPRPSSSTARSALSPP
ncbi:MAG: hypothetical protein ACO3RV_04400, partial [Luteolibacter sp.]